jgi:hypothetical protein
MTDIPKMIQLQADMRVLLINAPDEYLNSLKRVVKNIDTKLQAKEAEYDFIQIFYIQSDKLNQDFPKFKAALTQSGKLWVSWPKAKKLNTNLNLDSVIKIGYANGLVESNNIRIDNVWTSLKFTRPKPGKVYKNSHAELVL